LRHIPLLLPHLPLRTLGSCSSSYHISCGINVVFVHTGVAGKLVLIVGVAASVVVVVVVVVIVVVVRVCDDSDCQ